MLLGVQWQLQAVMWVRDWLSELMFELMTQLGKLQQSELVLSAMNYPAGKPAEQLQLSTSQKSDGKLNISAV